MKTFFILSPNKTTTDDYINDIIELFDIFQEDTIYIDHIMISNDKILKVIQIENETNKKGFHIELYEPTSEEKQTIQTNRINCLIENPSFGDSIDPQLLKQIFE